MSIKKSSVPERTPGLRAATALAVAAAFTLGACGGGGGTSKDAAPIATEPDSPDAQMPGTQTPDTVAPTPDTGTPDTQTPIPDADIPDAGPEAGTPTPADDDDDEQSNVNPSAPADLNQALIVVAESAPLPGAPDEQVRSLNAGTIKVNDTGGVSFGGGLNSLFSEEEGLWGGTLSAPIFLLRDGMSIDGIAPNIRIDDIQERTSHLADDGTVSVIASMSGASSLNVVLLSQEAAGMKAVFQSDQTLQLGERSLRLSSYSNVKHANGTIAVMGSDSVRNASLVVSSDDNVSFIAPSGYPGRDERTLLAPLQPDGCRIMLRGDRSLNDSTFFGVRPDGSVVFNGTVGVEQGADGNAAVCPDQDRIVGAPESPGRQPVRAGSRFDTVAIFRDGAYTRIVSAGDPVPNMDNGVFSAVSLVDILDDGALLVAAQINDTTVNDERGTSRWIFNEGAAPRLVLLNGETTESNVDSMQYTIDLDTYSAYSKFVSLDVSSDGASVLVDEFTSSNGDTVTWIAAGQAHQGQPHASLFAPGATPLQPTVRTGGSAPASYPDTTFWSSIGKAEGFSDGGGIFGASIVDSAPGAENPAAAGLWRFNANGEISLALPSEVTVTVNEIPRTIAVPFIKDWTLVGSSGVIFVEPGSGGTDRIVYIPF